MSEIPGPVWIAVGTFVAAVSLFLGFIRPVPSGAFFKMMMFVGIGMVLYGIFKVKVKTKTKEDVIEEARKRAYNRGQMEYDIDIDDYRANPRLRQEAMQRKQSMQSQPSQTQTNQSGRYPQNPQQYQAPQKPANIQNPGNYGGSQTYHHPTHSAQPQSSRFCHQCGTPLLKHHKFCPICGARV